MKLIYFSNFDGDRVFINLEKIIEITVEKDVMGRWFVSVIRETTTLNTQHRVSEQVAKEITKILEMIQ